MRTEYIHTVFAIYLRGE